MAGGRPTKYNQDMLDKANDYLENHAQYDDVVPSQAGLAYLLRVNIDTLTNWGNNPENTEFLGTLEDIQLKQHKLLINGGLKGDFTSPITKLMLCNHGYSDKVHNDNQSLGADGKPTDASLTVEFVGVKK